MPESGTHVRLVQALREAIANDYLHGNLAMILSDTAGGTNTDRSPTIEGYVPDVFVNDLNSPRIIIGEAKTSTDLDNRHSLSQLEAFIRYCNSVSGVFVLAVPWYIAAYAQNMLVALGRRKKMSVECCRILNSLPD